MNDETERTVTGAQSVIGVSGWGLTNALAI